MSDDLDVSGAAGGGKIANRILGIVTQGMVSTRASMAGHTRVLGASIVEDFFDKVSGEIRPTVGPMLAPVANHEALPESMRPLFRFLTTGNGQWQTFLGASVVGAAVSTGIGALLTNTLQIVTGPLVALAPNLPMSVSDAARAQATGFTGDIDMPYEAAQQGIESSKFDILVELSRPRPAPGEIVDLLNRGEVNEDYARTLFRESGYSPSDAGILLELRRALIDPARLADMVVFGILSQDTAESLAAMSGMRADDFTNLVKAAGEPPSTQELLFAYRRKVIDRDRLFHGIQQGRLKNEWFDVVESFGQVPMSTADAIEAAIKGHISEEQARTIAEQNGLIPEQFTPLFLTAGNPPGPQEMLHLLNRGIMTEAEVVQGLKESRLNNKYITAILASRFELPTEPQILSMMRRGVIPTARGAELLRWRGYPDDIVTDLVTEATQAPAQHAKELSLATVRALLLDKTITEAEAVARVKALGYSDADAALEIQVAQENQARRYLTAVVSRTHREYVEQLLTPDEAQTFLGQAGVPADQVTAELKIWDVERASVRRTLTEAQVGQALKKGLITVDQALTRWQAMGYSATDAGLLQALHAPATTTKAGP